MYVHRRILVMSSGTACAPVSMSVLSEGITKVRDIHTYIRNYMLRGVSLN